MPQTSPFSAPSPAGLKPAALILLVLTAGCVIEPKGYQEEKQKLAAAGKPYAQKDPQKRDLPPLPDDPDWPDLLQRAFLANGELESAYYQWQAAAARVRIAAAYPNTNLTVGYEYMFSKENLKSWNRTTLSVGVDPSLMLQWPGKAAKAGQIALAETRAAAARFEEAKFSLQYRVLGAWYDYALAAEKLRIQQENVDLLRMLMDTSRQRVQAGGPQQDLYKAQTEYELAANEAENMHAELSAMRAMLNGLLARGPDETLPPPRNLPPARTLHADDAQLLAVAVDKNPELAGIAQDVTGRKNALELAKLAYIPDFAPQFSLTGDISRSVGTMVTLPTALPKIKGAIQEARAQLQATEAMARQLRHERGASFVAALYALRNAERQAQVFADSILPKAQQMLSSTIRSYTTGLSPFGELVDSQRTLLDARIALAEARMTREKRLAELETLAGVDFETLPPTPAPGSGPPSNTSQITPPVSAPGSAGGYDVSSSAPGSAGGYAPAPGNALESAHPLSLPEGEGRGEGVSHPIPATPKDAQP
ncbi:MAG: TolC family protein [Phycisphaeraceae bacterium]|nr:TolC family protein [Phycisphaeraceae bacterium]